MNVNWSDKYCNTGFSGSETLFISGEFEFQNALFGLA